MANFNALNTVTANPTETATEELQKLKVGNTVYSVESGGSGVTIDIMQTGASGTLTAEQVALIVNNFPNVNISWLGQDIFMPLEYTTDNYKFAKVQTSDTQAETKLITVNAPTNTWNFTQYLADLGGGGINLNDTTKKIYSAEVRVSKKKLEYIRKNGELVLGQTYLFCISEAGDQFQDCKFFIPSTYNSPTLMMSYVEDTATYEYIFVFKLGPTLNDIQFVKQYRRTITDNTIEEYISGQYITSIFIYKIS